MGARHKALGLTVVAAHNRSIAIELPPFTALGSAPPQKNSPFGLGNRRVVGGSFAGAEDRLQQRPHPRPFGRLHGGSCRERPLVPGMPIIRSWRFLAPLLPPCVSLLPLRQPSETSQAGDICTEAVTAVWSSQWCAEVWCTSMPKARQRRDDRRTGDESVQEDVIDFLQPGRPQGGVEARCADGQW